MIQLKGALLLLVTMAVAIPSPGSKHSNLDTTSLNHDRETEPSKRDFGNHFEWMDYVQTESKMDDLAHSKTDGSEHIKSKRTDPIYGVYECAQEDFKGICKWTQVFVGEKKCHNRAFKDLGSLGPDPSVHCTVYSGPDCIVGSTGVSKDGLVYPGIKNCAAGNFWTVADGRSACPTSWACEVQLVRDASWAGNE